MSSLHVEERDGVDNVRGGVDVAGDPQTEDCPQQVGEVLLKVRPIDPVSREYLVEICYLTENRELREVSEGGLYDGLTAGL